jgi:hypothetical protein
VYHKDTAARPDAAEHWHSRVGTVFSRLTLFDYLVLAGGLVNLLVIGGIVMFWLSDL